MTGKITNPELQSLFDQLLPNLDSTYSKVGVSLPSRPLMAACFVVENYVVEVHGDTTDGYRSQKWFAAFYACAEGWYQNRYGPLLNHSGSSFIRGATQIYGMWCIVNIPLSFTRPNDENTAWAHFPRIVDEAEHPLDWIEKGPNLDNMSLSATNKIAQRVTTLAISIRNIHINLWADYSGQQELDTADHVRTHLSTAAQHFSNNDTTTSTLALWELNFAAEKAFKLWLNQHDHSNTESHDLITLNKQVSEKSGIELVDVSTLERLPSGTEAIKYRYRTLAAPSLERQRNIYGLTLEVIQQITQRLKRELHFHDNFAVKFKKASWLG